VVVVVGRALQTQHKLAVAAQADLERGLLTQLRLA
jgi:hypothetical protein